MNAYNACDPCFPCKQDIQAKLGDAQQLCSKQEADMQALSTLLNEKQQSLVELEAVREGRGGLGLMLGLHRL